MLSMLSRGFRQKLENGVKKTLNVISNEPGFKLFTLYQAIEEVYCREQPGVTFLTIFCKRD